MAIISGRGTGGPTFYVSDGASTAYTSETWINSYEGAVYTYDTQGRYIPVQQAGSIGLRENTTTVTTGIKDIFGYALSAMGINLNSGSDSEMRRYIHRIMQESEKYLISIAKAWELKDTLGERLSLLSDIVIYLSIFNEEVRRHYWPIIMDYVQEILPLSNKIIQTVVNDKPVYIKVDEDSLRHSRISIGFDTHVFTRFEVKDRMDYPSTMGHGRFRDMDTINTIDLITGGSGFIRQDIINVDTRLNFLQKNNSQRGYCTRAFLPLESFFIPIQHFVLWPEAFHSSFLGHLFTTDRKRVYEMYSDREIVSIARSIPHLVAVLSHKVSGILPHHKSTPINHPDNTRKRDLIGIL